MLATMRIIERSYINAQVSCYELETSDEGTWYDAPVQCIHRLESLPEMLTQPHNSSKNELIAHTHPHSPHRGGAFVSTKCFGFTAPRRCT